MTKDELSPPPRKSDQPDPVLPDALEGKYLRVGRNLYRNSDDKKPIASITPEKITTASADALRDVIRIAKANDWSAIRIEGSREFKRLAYLEAALQGISVEGYKPSKLVEADAERNRQRFALTDQRTSKMDPASNPSASQNQSLAERFLAQSHDQNAKDDELRKAQGLVALAIAIARGRYPENPKQQSKFIDQEKQRIATFITRGETLSSVKIAPNPATAKNPPLLKQRIPDRER